MKILLILLTSLLFMGCSKSVSHDQKLCKTANGDILLLKHNFGDTYFIDVYEYEQYEKLINIPKGK